MSGPELSNPLLTPAPLPALLLHAASLSRGPPVPPSPPGVMPYDAPPPDAGSFETSSLDARSGRTLEVRGTRERDFGPAVARAVGDVALALAWRVVHVRSREVFLGAAPTALPRLYYTADDGWRAPVYVIPAFPGTTGEPVLLAHGLGGSAVDFDLGPASLARRLSDAGYTVYLFEHRGDRSAIAPVGALPFTADDLATRDLDAAIAAIQLHSGFSRILAVGHGFGAQLLLLRYGLIGVEDIAGTVLISGAVTFTEARSSARSWGQVAQMLPSSLVVPGRLLQQLAAPFVGSGADLGSPGTEGSLARAHLRHASSDLHLGVLKQVGRWLGSGRLTDATGRFDVVAGLPRCASLVIEPDDDPACPVGAAEPAAEPLGAFFERLSGGWGHLDPLLGARASAEVHPRVLNFLEACRRKCW